MNMEVKAASLPLPPISTHSSASPWHSMHTARGGTKRAPQCRQRDPMSRSSLRNSSNQWSLMGLSSKTYLLSRMVTVLVPPGPAQIVRGPQAQVGIGHLPGAGLLAQLLPDLHQLSRPVAPTGWPLHFRPPEVLTGLGPWSRVAPSSTAL